MHWALNVSYISYCLSSSRANTTRRGWRCSSKRRMKLRPNDPVPPEMKIDLALNLPEPLYL